jgi:hypothetical protein
VTGSKPAALYRLADPSTANASTANDLVVARCAICFSDPPFGLPKSPTIDAAA